MSDSDLLEVEFLKIKLGKASSLTLPLTPYIALFTTMPNEAGTGGVEVSTSGSGYARLLASDKFPTPVSTSQVSGLTVVSNNVIVDFGVATSNWGTLAGFALMTAVTAGSVLSMSDEFAPISIVNGQPALFAVGSMSFRQG